MTDAEIIKRLKELAAVLLFGVSEGSAVRTILRHVFEQVQPDEYEAIHVEMTHSPVIVPSVLRDIHFHVDPAEYRLIYHSIFNYEPSDFLKLRS